MKEALYYNSFGDGTVECVLCPHKCFINAGKRGICDVRRNEQGRLLAENYGRVSSMAIDQMEKKPLYHFFPGKYILSVGSLGCNLNCRFCQNWQISRASGTVAEQIKYIEPQRLAQIALDEDENIGIAYTYNEPVVSIEYVLNTATLVHQNGQKNIMVSNGYINPEPLEQLLPLIDAFNIDLKAFTDEFYRKQTMSKRKPVLETLKQIRRSGKHLEITNLVVPPLNNHLADFDHMIQWIHNELGSETVVHLSRYFPNYKLSLEASAPEIMHTLYEKATKHLKYVYLGNMTSESGRNTLCSQCRTMVIARKFQKTIIVNLDKQGQCSHCGNTVAVCE